MRRLGGLAILLSKTAGSGKGGSESLAARSDDDGQLDRLDGLLEEYEKADKRKDKARALRAFVRLAHDRKQGSE